MEVKPKPLETKKITTKVDQGEMKTKKDDVTTTNGDQEITIIKGNLKIFEGLRQGKPRNDHSPPKSSRSSSSYVMKIRMGNYKNSIPRAENIQKVENIDKMKKKKVWDCESTLYDSFELNSFNRQLDSAIASSARSMSMPHFPPPPSKTISSSSSSSPTEKKKSSNKISRSLQKLIKSMFRHKHTNTPSPTSCDHAVDMDKYYVVFDKTGTLTTIPESRESTELVGGVGSEVDSVIRKNVSERFPPSRLNGITCS